MKLYAVNPDEIKESKPRFQCVACEKKFWIAYPESVGAGEVMGFPVEWLEKKIKEPVAALRQEERIQADFVEEQRPVESKAPVMPQAQAAPTKDPCPKCKSLYTRGERECPHCGVVIARWEDLQKLKAEEEQGFPSTAYLRQCWDAVLEDYDNEKVHQGFLAVCQEERNLVFASRQYGRILAAHAGDEMAQKMRAQVMALSQVSMDVHKSKPKTKQPVKYWSFTGFVLFFSAVLIAVGFFLEPWRNMVGVGVAMIFFVLAFRK